MSEKEILEDKLELVKTMDESINAAIVQISGMNLKEEIKIPLLMDVNSLINAYREAVDKKQYRYAMDLAQAVYTMAFVQPKQND